VPDRAPRSPGLRTQARQVGLVRLLLLSLGLGVLVILVGSGRRELVEPAATWLQRTLVAVAVLAFPLLGAGWLVRHRWQLAVLLGFDLAWSALIIHFSGGVGSPGVLLPPIIVLVGTLALPRAAPFALPALGSALLAGSAALYLTGHAPFGEAFLALNPALVDAQRVIGSLITQIAALFLVDLLGQLLGRRLHEQRIFTGELLDQLGEGVLAIDHQGVIAYANAEAVRLLRLGGPVQGLQVSALLGDETLRPILALLEQGECPALDRVPGPQGRQLVLRVTQLLDRRGVPIGRTLLIADETRLKILEDSAHRAEHLLALGEMAAGIAHEVRNPLTSLRGCAQELAEISAEGGQRDAESLARILVSEADRLARIVEDFLSLSRLRTPLRESVELTPLFAELETLCRGRGDLPDGLKLLFSVSEDCTALLADPGQIRQVLGNLLNNALDALRQAPVPCLSCVARSVSADCPLRVPAVEIAVTDNGCGIPKDIQTRIFTPFFSTKSQGTGLGLSLVQRIVREHEGALHLTSDQGKGTTVLIYLPVHTQTRVFKRALGAK
jgi:signal transduction histidine kinase